MLFDPVTHALAAWRRLLLPQPHAEPQRPALDADAPLDIDLTRLEVSASMEWPPADGAEAGVEAPPVFEETLPGLKADASGWRTQPFVRYNA